jgi:transcriptional regulator with XRE-family HTH domain
MSETHDTFGHWLRACLTDRGLTQTALSKRVGVSAPYINDIVRDRRIPPRRTVEKIAAALGESVDYPAALCGHLPPFMDGIGKSDLDALAAMMSLRREIWPRKVAL